MRIKTPKTQTLFERDTQGAIRLVLRGLERVEREKALVCIIEPGQGMCDVFSSAFGSVPDLGFQILFKCELTV